MMCGLQPIVFDPNLGPSNNGNFWRKICVWKIRSPEDFLQLFLLDTLQARRAAMTGKPLQSKNDIVTGGAQALHRNIARVIC